MVSAPAMARRHRSGLPAGTWSLIALGLPFVGAVTVVGIYLNKEIIVAAAWVAFAVAGAPEPGGEGEAARPPPGHVALFLRPPHLLDLHLRLRPGAARREGALRDLRAGPPPRRALGADQLVAGDPRERLPRHGERDGG